MNPSIVSDTEEEFEAEGKDNTINIPCFRIVVTKNKISQSESTDSTDSEPDTESSGSIESETELELGSKEEYYPLLDYNNCRFQHPVQPQGQNLDAQV